MSTQNRISIERDGEGNIISITEIIDPGPLIISDKEYIKQIFEIREIMKIMHSPCGKGEEGEEGEDQ